MGLPLGASRGGGGLAGLGGTDGVGGFGGRTGAAVSERSNGGGVRGTGPSLAEQEEIRVVITARCTLVCILPLLIMVLLRGRGTGLGSGDRDDLV